MDVMRDVRWARELSCMLHGELGLVKWRLEKEGRLAWMAGGAIKFWPGCGNWQGEVHATIFGLVAWSLVMVQTMWTVVVTLRLESACRTAYKRWTSLFVWRQNCRGTRVQPIEKRGRAHAGSAGSCFKCFGNFCRVLLWMLVSCILWTYYESNEVQLSHINVMLIAFYISASWFTCQAFCFRFISCLQVYICLFCC